MTKLKSVPQVVRRDLSSADGPSHLPAMFPRSPGSTATAPPDVANSDNSSQSPWRNWPSGIKATSIRRKWFEKLQPLPKGLDLAEIAARLNEPYHAVYRWALFFRYPFPDRRSYKPSLVDWDNVDWSQRDAEIARGLGVSRERVRQVRRKRGIGAPATPVRRFAAFIAANPQRVASLTVQEAVLATGETLGLQAARRVLRNAGIKPVRKKHGPAFDWRIPNRDLAAIWGVPSHFVAVTRRRLGVGPAKWNLRGGATIRSRAYKKLLEQEKLNARRAANADVSG